MGCGDGVLTAEIKAKGCKVVGIDFSPDMIAAAVKKVGFVRLACASLLDARPILTLKDFSPRWDDFMYLLTTGRLPMLIDRCSRLSGLVISPTPLVAVQTVLQSMVQHRPVKR